MGKVFIDPGLFGQTTLDSAALSQSCVVVQQFPLPGEYRGTIRRGDDIERVFYLVVDKESSVAAADVDLAWLAGEAPEAVAPEGCCRDERETRYAVNPRGYALFRVSRGNGGYSVNLRRADPDEDTPVFTSTALGDGAIFSARVLRPGAYRVTNTLAKAEAKLTVGYPPKPFSGYRPPEPLRVDVTEKGFSSRSLDLKPAQGLIFECRTASRIVIELLEPDERGRRR